MGEARKNDAPSSVTEVCIEHRYPDSLSFLQAHGPEALAVLHGLLSLAEKRGSQLMVEATIRQIAERLRFLSKDTVHRRLRQLLHAGIVRRLPVSSRPTFTPSTYVIDLTGTGISITKPTTASNTEATLSSPT